MLGAASALRNYVFAERLVKKNKKKREEESGKKKPSWKAFSSAKKVKIEKRPDSCAPTGAWLRPTV